MYDIFCFFTAVVLIGAVRLSVPVSLCSPCFGSDWILGSRGAKRTDHGFTGIVDSVGGAV